MTIDLTADSTKMIETAGCTTNRTHERTAVAITEAVPLHAIDIPLLRRVNHEQEVKNALPGKSANVRRWKTVTDHPQKGTTSTSKAHLLRKKETMI